MSWFRNPALLVTLFLFFAAQWETSSTFLENHDWAWNIYVALTGVILFIEGQLPWQFEGYYAVLYQFALHYAFFYALFKGLSMATKPLRWTISLLFILLGLTLYWTQLAGAN